MNPSYVVRSLWNLNLSPPSRCAILNVTHRGAMSDSHSVKICVFTGLEKSISLPKPHLGYQSRVRHDSSSSTYCLPRWFTCSRCVTPRKGV